MQQVIFSHIVSIQKKIFSSWFFVFVLLFSGMSSVLWYAHSVDTATPPAIVTYQGKLLENGAAVTTTKAMAFVIYDASSGGTALYTAAGTLPATSTISVTPTQGIFSVDLGGSGTNALDSTIFQDNDELYLEVVVAGTALTPRKRLTASPYAVNSTYLNGAQATSTPQSTTYIPLSAVDGSFVFNTTTFNNAITVSSTVTSTFLGSIDLATGNCFSVNGTCITGGSSQWTDSGSDIYFSSGNVGINTTTPGYDLTISGTAYVTGTTTLANGGIVATTLSAGPATYTYMQLGNTAANQTGAITLYAGTTAGTPTLAMYNTSGSAAATLLTAGTGGVAGVLALGTSGVSGGYGSISLRDENGATAVQISGASNSYVYFLNEVMVGATTESIATTTFVMDSDGFYVEGDAGFNGNIFSDGILDIAGSGTSTFAGSLDIGGSMIVSGASASLFEQSVLIGSSTVSISNISFDMQNNSLYIDGQLGVNGKVYFDNNLDVASSVTSTFGGSIDIATGCFAVAGTCLVATQWSNDVSDIYFDSGNVGIGTNSPNNPLEIEAGMGSHGTVYVNGANNSDSAYIILNSASNLDTGLQFKESGTALWTLFTNPSTDVLMLDPAEPDSSIGFFFTQTGFLGIGDTSPNYLLDVATSTDAVLAEFTDADGTCTVNPGDGDFSCTSDRNLKTNIAIMSSALDSVMQLNPVTYNWNTDPNGEVNYGFIAQEVEAIFPRLVGNGASGYKTLSQIGLIPFLTKAIQEQQLQINTLSSTLLQGSGADLINGSFEGTLRVAKHVSLGEDTVGQVKLLSGATSVRVTFADLYEHQPIVTVSPLAFITGQYRVTEENEEGFTLELSESQSSDVTFNWHAFAGEGAKLTVSDGSFADITLVVVDNVAENSSEGGGSESQGGIVDEPVDNTPEETLESGELVLEEEPTIVGPQLDEEVVSEPPVEEILPPEPTPEPVVGEPSPVEEGAL